MMPLLAGVVLLAQVAASTQYGYRFPLPAGFAEFPEAAKNFEQPIMDRTYFDRLSDRFRSPHLWTWTNEGWKLRKTVFDAA